MRDDTISELELVAGDSRLGKQSWDNISVSFDGMQRDVSQATWNTHKQTETFWSVLNVISDNKIEKFEWDFVLKMVGDGIPILSQDQSDFLFMYLDKDNSGDITKPELRALLNLVVRKNKWGYDNSPTLNEMIKCTYEYALEDKQKVSPIDFQLQTAVIAVRNKLTKFQGQIKNAKKCNEDLNKVIEESSTVLFSNPQKIFDTHLNEHALTIDKYAVGPLQSQYNEVKKLLKTASEEFNLLNSRVKQFTDQDSELKRMRARDAKCCKIFGCVCPCAF